MDGHFIFGLYIFLIDWYYSSIQKYRVNREIQAKELRVVDEAGGNLGVVAREEAFRLAQERGLDIIEIAPQANPPVARIISFDKFRYQKEKEERKQRQAQKPKDLKHIKITPRSALNDLQLKVRQIEKFFEAGHKVEINLFLRGREKFNREWSMKKLKEFMELIQVPYAVTMPPKPGGRGFVVQIAKK